MAHDPILCAPTLHHRSRLWAHLEAGPRGLPMYPGKCQLPEVKLEQALPGVEALKGLLCAHYQCAFIL